MSEILFIRKSHYGWYLDQRADEDTFAEISRRVISIETNNLSFKAALLEGKGLALKDHKNKEIGIYTNKQLFITDIIDNETDLPLNVVGINKFSRMVKLFKVNYDFG